MRLPRECYQMQKTIETHLPHLSQPQLMVLWVCGAILAGSACQNAVASALSRWNNLRQYLREWLYDGSDRTSPCQTQLDVTLCFAPLLRWVLAWWRSGRLALAIDPTLKGDQTTAISSAAVAPSPWPGASILDGPHRAAQRTGPGSSQGPSSCSANLQRCGSRYALRAGIPVCATAGTSLSAPTAANDCPPSACFPSRYGLGLAGAPPSVPQPKAPLHPGCLVRRAGSSSPTLRPIRPSWYALRFWIEEFIKSLGWK